MEEQGGGSVNYFRCRNGNLFPAPFCRSILLEALGDLNDIARGNPAIASLPEYYLEERVLMLRDLINQLPAAEPESQSEQPLGTQPKDR